MKKLVILGNRNKQQAVEAVRQLLPFIGARAEILANGLDGPPGESQLAEAELALVFGGDGSMLAAARILGYRPVPLMGVKIGKLGGPPSSTSDSSIGM